MSCSLNPRSSPSRRRLMPIALAVAASMVLSACGGGASGGGVASIPPPPPPPASPPPPAAPTLVSTSVSVAPIPSPATRPGTSDTIALIEHFGAPSTYRLAEPSEVRITTYQQRGNQPGDISYTMEFPSQELPGGKSSLTAILGVGNLFEQWAFKFGDRATITSTYSDGSQKVEVEDRSSELSDTPSEPIGAGRHLWSNLFYSVGLSHVSLGEWMWRVHHDDGSESGLGRAYFVHGDRTPAAEIPTSGTATYTAASLGQDTDAPNWEFLGPRAPVRIALTADFGQRSISAQLNRDYSATGDNISITSSSLGVDLHGTGPIASLGSFSIPLVGTATDGGVVPNRMFQVTGALDGAFFGPNAEQVGGVFAVGQTPGVPLVSDAFVGTRN